MRADRISVSIALLALIILISCSDPSSIPTPSVLTVSFTGDSLPSTNGTGSVVQSLADTGDLNCQVTAEWTRCPDPDFQRYLLYRAGWSGISWDPSTATVIGVLEGRNDTLFVDNGVYWGDTWFYAVRSENTSDNGAWSNEVGIDLPGDQPEPVFITAESESIGIVLDWTVCGSEDFHSNTLYRSTTGQIAGDTASAELMGTFTSATDTTWTDTDVTTGTKYYYAMLTMSVLGLYAWSSEVSVIHYAVPEFPYRIIDQLAGGWFGSDIVISWTGDYVVQPHSSLFPVNVYRASNHSLAYTLETPTYLGAACPLPFGNTVYLASVTEGLIWLVDLDQEAITDTIQVTVIPGGMCADPNGGTAYVASDNDHVIQVIDTELNEVVDWIYTWDNVNNVTCHPSGDWIYASSDLGDNVAVISTADMEVVTVVEVGDRPIEMCCHPDGSSLYVLCSEDSKVYEMDCSTNRIVDSWGNSGSPAGMCILPSGDYLYVTDNWSNQVNIYETEGNSLVLSVNLPAHTSDAAATPDGQKVFMNSWEIIVVLGF